ncbi:MAG: PorV/PorQ family protein [Candidatus Eisenbacteria bacterium]|nr:PorV/PorQ family protein [Candidatus Eisenbacteria bacterium]
MRGIAQKGRVTIRSRPEIGPCGAVATAMAAGVRASSSARVTVMAAAGLLAATLLLLALSSGTSVAASSVSGGTESIFSLGAGSRALGMGGAFTAISDDATATYWNPAGLSCLGQTGITGFHSLLFEGSSLDFFSIAHPTVRFGGIGFAFLRVGTDGIQAYDDRSRSLGQIGFSQSEMIFSYGRKIPFNVNVGASLKIVNQGMGELSTNGAGFDVGALYSVPYVKGLALGLAARDVPGAKLKLADRVENTPRTLRAGGSYRDSLRGGRDVLLVGIDVSLPEKANTNVSVGGEYVVDQLVALRAGFKEGKLCAGVGVKWRSYSLDYSIGNSELGNLHQFSVSATFGDPIALRKEREERERKRELARMLEEEKAKRIEAHAELARRAFDQASYSSALDEWNLVLEYDPENAQAKESVKKIREALARKTEEEARMAGEHAKLHVLLEVAKEYVSQGDFNAGLLRFRQANELEPGNAEALSGIRQADSLIAVDVASNVALAKNLAASGKYLEAYSAWNKVLILSPENEEARRGMETSKSAVETVGRDLVEAMRRIDALTLYTNAVTAYDRENYTEAKAQLQEMLKLYPADQEGLRLAEKIEERLSPKTPKVEENVKKLYVEGMNHFNLGEYEKAIESWKKIMAVDPQNEMVARNIEKAKARLSSGERKAQ